MAIPRPDAPPLVWHRSRPAAPHRRPRIAAHAVPRGLAKPRAPPLALGRFSDSLDTWAVRLDTFVEKLDTLGAEVNTFGEKLNTVRESVEHFTTRCCQTASSGPLIAGWPDS